MSSIEPRSQGFFDATTARIHSPASLGDKGSGFERVGIPHGEIVATVDRGGYCLGALPSPALGRVKIDPGHVEQIIMNLAINARDAMPGGGQVTIETNNIELDQNDAPQHSSIEAGAYVMLNVSETGYGMDTDTQSRIFEPFFMTKGSKETGLGLATVYGIVKQNGGSIDVSSNLGKGTTFNIYLPRTEEAAERLESLSAPNAALGGSETILLVEDDEMVRALAQTILERNGYTVLATKHVNDAMTLAQQRPEISIFC